MNFVLLLGRLLASPLFLMAGYGKLMGMAGTVGYFTKLGIPQPQLAYYVVVAAELGGGALLLLGFQTRVVAALLAVFTLTTAYFGHANLAEQAQVTQLLKNMAIAGGFLAFVVAGAGAFSLDGLRRRA